MSFKIYSINQFVAHSLSDPSFNLEWDWGKILAIFGCDFFLSLSNPNATGTWLQGPLDSFDNSLSEGPRWKHPFKKILKKPLSSWRWREFLRSKKFDNSNTHKDRIMSREHIETIRHANTNKYIITLFNLFSIEVHIPNKATNTKPKYKIKNTNENINPPTQAGAGRRRDTGGWGSRGYAPGLTPGAFHPVTRRQGRATMFRCAVQHSVGMPV